MALGVLIMSGCQQANNVVNSNTATNTNTTANSNTASNSNSAANSNASANTNANSNVTANNNANANTSASPTNSAANANTSASNTVTNTATAVKEEKPLTAEEQEFKNTLVGEWKNDQMTLTFTEDKIVSSDTGELSYRVVDEKTVEIKKGGQSAKATMSFEDNGKTLNWSDPSGKYKYTRVK